MIYENDSAHDVADEFCQKYFLGQELKVEFTKQIEENI